MQWTVWGLTIAVWLVQTTRWWRRVFGINYRLTTRRLRIDMGHWRPRHCAVDLVAITHVEARLDRLGRWTKVGRVMVHTAPGSAPIVLEGVRYPEHVAARIRAMCQTPPRQFMGRGAGVGQTEPDAPARDLR